MPFIEAVAQMPKYAKFLKKLLINRKKLEEVSKVVLNENCSAAMLKKLPKKMGDPGMLTLPCQFGNLATSYALADSGASVNLMPYSFSKITLRVGDESVTFGFDKAIKYSKYSGDTTFSVDTLDELMEEWKEDNSKDPAITLEYEFHAERDMKEIERMLEESEYEEII